MLYRSMTISMWVETCIPAMWNNIYVSYYCVSYFICLFVQLILYVVFFCCVPPVSPYLCLSPYGGDRCPLSCQGDWFTLTYLQACSHTQQPNNAYIIHPYTKKPTYTVYIVNHIHNNLLHTVRLSHYAILASVSSHYDLLWSCERSD